MLEIVKGPICNSPRATANRVVPPMKLAGCFEKQMLQRKNLLRKIQNIAWLTLTLNSNAMTTKLCNCGKIGDVYSTDENECVCWDCFYELPVIVPTEYWEPRRPSADELEDELPF